MFPMLMDVGVAPLAFFMFMQKYIIAGVWPAEVCNNGIWIESLEQLHGRPTMVIVPHQDSI